MTTTAAPPAGGGVMGAHATLPSATFTFALSAGLSKAGHPPRSRNSSWMGSSHCRKHPNHSQSRSGASPWRPVPCVVNPCRADF
jgi:hypothetical protein